MKHKITFAPSAFESYKEWAKANKTIFLRINELIQNIDRTPYQGIGKPEPLKHQLKGYWQDELQKNTGWFIRLGNRQKSLFSSANSIIDLQKLK